MRARLMTVLLASAPFLTAAPAWAQAPAADQAAMLQKQLREWFVNLLAPAVMLPEPPLAITQDGDRFKLTLPLAQVTGRQQDEVTASLRALEGTRWSVEDFHVPSEGEWKIPLPADKPDTISEVAYSIGEQAIRMVIDTALASRSNVSLELRDLTLRVGGLGQKQEQRVERYAFQGSLIPSADGRLDFTQEGTLSGWMALSQGNDGPPVGFQVRRLRGSGRIEGISRDRLEQGYKAIQALVAETAPGKGVPTLTDASRVHVRTLIEAIRDATTRFEAEESIDDLRVEVAGIGNAAVGQVRFGMGAEAPGGRLRAWLDLAMESPTFDGIPPSLQRYMPTRVSFKPAITGINTDRMFKLLLDATAESPDEDKIEAEAMALITTGDASVGLEALSLELDTLRLEGSGRMRMIAPDKAGIEARLSAAGLDDLIAKAKTDPDLAPAMPALVMIRGLARPDGSRLVWDLAITEDQALVNGVDVMAMGNAGGPPAQQAPAQKPSRR